ncbi:MAG: BamA/TamA family outer membrane protein [Pelovirga sp.]
MTCLLLLPAAALAATLEIEVRGVDRPLQQAIRDALVPPLLAADDDRLNRQRLRSFQRQLPRMVRDTLEPYGYFHAESSNRLEHPAADLYVIVIDVAPGEPLRVTSVDLVLLDDLDRHARLVALVDNFPLQVGAVLRQDLYDKAKAELRQEAIGLGYLDANYIRQEILVYLEQRSAAIVLHLAGGLRYRFGETRYENQAGYPERFLNRFLSYRRDEPFSYSLLGQTQINLLDADLFRTVSVRPVTEAATAGRVPVAINLTTLPRHRLRPGVGYGTDTGARVSLEYRNLNLFSLAHELHGKLLLAEWRQSVETTYIIPDPRRLDSVTLLRLGVERENIDSFYRREIFSEAEYRRSFGRGYSGSLFLRLMTERSRIADQNDRSQLLLPGVRLGWQRIDDPLNPRRGAKIQFELLGGDENLLSDTSLLQLSGDVATLLPLPSNFSLHLRLRGGTTWHKDSFSTLPVSLRYFAGGDRSVRGYKYNSLGPTNADGEVIGGKHLLVGSFELEKRFRTHWGAAIFYDVGNAFDNVDDYRLKQGAGIGVRRYTRIGAIRIDLARQLGEDGNRLRLHLSVGLGW